VKLSVIRETAALDDLSAVESLLAVLPVPVLIRAHLEGARGLERQAVQYDPRRETLHYVASDRMRMVRLSAAGIPQRDAPSAVLATHDILKLSAKACGLKLEKLFVGPARAPSSKAEVPATHPQVREQLRIVPVIRVPVL
jgi:hypothetical protein